MKAPKGNVEVAAAGGCATAIVAPAHCRSQTGVRASDSVRSKAEVLVALLESRAEEKRISHVDAIRELLDEQA